LADGVAAEGDGRELVELGLGGGRNPKQLEIACGRGAGREYRGEGRNEGG